MIAAAIANTAAHLREIAATELSAFNGDRRARAMATRLRLLAQILDDDARMAARLEAATLVASAREPAHG
jgi:hypothetical protein